MPLPPLTSAFSFYQVSDTCCCCQYYIHNTSRNGVWCSLVSPSRTYVASIVISGAKIRSIRVQSSRNSSQPLRSRGSVCPIMMGRKRIGHQHWAAVRLISNPVCTDGRFDDSIPLCAERVNCMRWNESCYKYIVTLTGNWVLLYAHSALLKIWFSSSPENGWAASPPSFWRLRVRHVWKITWRSTEYIDVR